MARMQVRDTFYAAYVRKRSKSSGYESELNIGPYDTIGVAQAQLTREINDIAKYGHNVEVLVSELRKGTVVWETVDPKAEKKRIKDEKIAEKLAIEEAKVQVKKNEFWAEFNGTEFDA